MSVCAVSSLQLKDLLDGQPDLLLIDVRMPAEFREVHVVGAKNIPLDRLSAEELSGALGPEYDSPVYFICTKGKASQKACQKAQGLGVDDVVNVEGGTSVCIAAGLPVERGKKAVSLERQVRITAGTLIIVGAVLTLAVHPYWVALSAVIGAGLTHSGLTDTCGMAVLLTKMPWNR
jgi:rhodanese-related sulfurtransferase